MRRAHPLSAPGGWLVLGLVGAGCAALSGVDDFRVGEEAPPGPGGGGGGGATSTATTTSTSVSTTTTGGGQGGAAGGAPGLADVVASVDDMRVELMCLSQELSFCDTIGVVEDCRSVGGDPGVTYEVDLQIRGVAEFNSYTGGTPDGQLRAGGEPSGSWNLYWLDTAVPPQTYWVNNGSCCPDFCEEIDIRVSVLMEGGSEVCLTGDDLNERSVNNRGFDQSPIVVEEVPPFNVPFDGQFVHIDALAARVHAN